MRARHCLLALAATAAIPAAVHGLTAPSASDGPVKLLTCTVTPQGILEAEVDSQSDDSMSCNIRCGYELGGKMFSYNFNVTIPKRFHGRVGRFDTSNARAGNYSGDVGNCQKTLR
jgi:hypothetical protein